MLCAQANAIVTLTSAAPGFQGFYDPSAALLAIQFQTADFDALLRTTPNSTLNRAFPKMQTDCLVSLLELNPR